MIGQGFDHTDFQQVTGVSDETLEYYQNWFDLLVRWNSKINLVGSRTLGDFWFRHAMDSHQIYASLPADARTVIDLGAGAGFPGIALAIMMRETEGAQVTMVESNGKKCNFLRAVIRELSLPAEAVQERAEALAPKPYDVVTARAFAPLPRLLSYAQTFWHTGTIGIFPKGESWESEISNAETGWDFNYTTQPSETEERARILRVEGLQQKQNERGESIDQKRA